MMSQSQPQQAKVLQELVRCGTTAMQDKFLNVPLRAENTERIAILEGWLAMGLVEKLEVLADGASTSWRLARAGCCCCCCCCFLFSLNQLVVCFAYFIISML